MEFFGFNFSDRSISVRDSLWDHYVKSTLTCIFYEHFFCLQITDVDNVSNHLESIIDASVSFRTEVRNVALSLKKSESKVRRFVASNFSFKFDEQI